MNKTAIKNFAARARRKLIEDITQKVYELGITENDIREIETFEGGFRVHGGVNGKTYKKYEIKQREKLIEKINRSGYEHIVDEVAYTWFNRFIALRFMEVNEYLPTGVRVLSSKEAGKTEPDIIKEALNVDLDIDKDIVYKLIDANDTEDLYKYLIIKQCNQLGEIMPMVFEEISDYTELLLPDNLLAEGSVIRELVGSIDEEDYKDQVEIIGWMYQYYISEKKDEVFADLKKNKKITKDNIPAATQLFTPKWIVKYMVENSLGRLWLESHPDEELKVQWRYFLEEAEQEPKVQKKLDELKNPNLRPEEIKVLDPACGSGHILVYAFDVLYDIYLKANYSERDIPQLILEKNLYGLDIDDRAGQLASFALMMKARSKNKRIFRKKVNLNVCSIQESNGITREAIEYFIGTESNVNKSEVEYLFNTFYDAKEYGSTINVNNLDFGVIEKRIEEIRTENSNIFNMQYRDIILDKLPSLVIQGRTMSEKYDIVCTNPPYMGNNGINDRLKTFLDRNYFCSKMDLFSVFIEVSFRMLKYNGIYSMINQHSWMFLSSFYNLRLKILSNEITINMLHLGPRTFEEIAGEVVQSTAFTQRKMQDDNYISRYIRLVDENTSKEKEQLALNIIKDSGKIYEFKTYEFMELPNCTIAYWVNKKMIQLFKQEKKIKDYYECKSGIMTGNDDLFLRLWHEVSSFNVKYDANSYFDMASYTWFPLNKGGGFRRYYGNNEYIINLKDMGQKIKEISKNFRLRDKEYYFLKGISWSRISTGDIAFRDVVEGSLFADAGPMIFISSDIERKYILALLNSKVIVSVLKILNPTMNYQVNDIENIPVIKNESSIEKVVELVGYNITFCKDDWDFYEASWDFTTHPFLNNRINPMYLDLNTGLPNKTIKDAYEAWTLFSEQQFVKLKFNEQELNRIFIEIYGLQDELNTEVDDKDITIRKADKERDIKSFLSYAVGCMFGRYSLDEEGLICADGEFDISKYKKIIPTTDNVLVIVDDDYFEDDIVNRFVEFVKITFGKETLEKNLDYIAETLGVKTGETSKQTIRRYFIKDFYNDHVKTYKKRPIYWQFDSGKQNGFKALIYMHRYDSSTVARVRIDYLHKLQKRYEAELKRLDLLLESDLSPKDAAATKKKKDNISKQVQECLAYDQVIAHVANQKIEIDLDDGVAINYVKFQNIEVMQGEGKKPIKANLLAKL